MQAKTTEKMNEIVAAARAGHAIYPAFWQPRRGVSNTISAAIRAALKANLLEIAGTDGCGKPYYRAALPAATHAASATVN